MNNFCQKCLIGDVNIHQLAWRDEIFMVGGWCEKCAMEEMEVRQKYEQAKLDQEPNKITHYFDYVFPVTSAYGITLKLGSRIIGTFERRFPAFDKLEIEIKQKSNRSKYRGPGY